MPSIDNPLTADLKVSLLGDHNDGKVEDFQEKVRSDSVYSHISPSNSAALTTFLLLNTMIGSGILNQPFVFKESGVVGGVIGYVIASILTWLSIVILNEAGVKLNILEYSGLARSTFGTKGEKLFDYTIVVTGCGAHFGYVIIVGETLSSLLDSWGCASFMCSEVSVILISVVLFMSPLCLFRHFGHFAWLSVFSVVAILAVLFLVIIAGPLKQHEGEIKIFDGLGALKSIGSILFSLSCAIANFQAYTTTEPKSQNPTSWMMITGVAILVGSLMCAGMGISGYLAFRDDTEGEILDNFVEPGFDFFKVMVAVHLILYIPVNFVVTRYSLCKVVYAKKAESLPWRQHVIVTFSLLAFQTGFVILLLAIGFSSGAAFSLILNITGGIGGTLATFMLPAAMYMKLHDKGDSLYTISLVVMVVAFILFVGIMSGIVLDSL